MAHLEGQERARYVARMFGRISRRYDLLNTIMTAGRHHAWRRLAADMAVGEQVGPALDVATGTGDLAMDLARKSLVVHVVGVDFSREMLRIAQRKATKRRGMAGRVSYVAGETHSLPFPDDHFICATVGFGIRNFADPLRALREMARVVRPGGRIVVLEIVRLDGVGTLSQLFTLYFRYVTPLLGAVFAGDWGSYTYLPASVQGFLGADELTTMMKEAGFQRVTFRRLALGAVAICVGEKRR